MGKRESERNNRAKEGVRQILVHVGGTCKERKREKSVVVETLQKGYASVGLALKSERSTYKNGSGGRDVFLLFETEKSIKAGKNLMCPSEFPETAQKLLSAEFDDHSFFFHF